MTTSVPGVKWHTHTDPTDRLGAGLPSHAANIESQAKLTPPGYFSMKTILLSFLFKKKSRKSRLLDSFRFRFLSSFYTSLSVILLVSKVCVCVYHSSGIPNKMTQILFGKSFQQAYLSLPAHPLTPDWPTISMSAR